ncbi:transposase [Streptomyces africanus]|uniref:transposase n=1 Tax=Streptomyces africanus TaxID=231024 RepID=UPI003CC5D0D6
MGLWDDENFVSWYPRDGRLSLSPAQLATVCVPQFLLNLSDRQAAQAVRCRIDFTYALAMELDDLSFHYSVLTDFRDRRSRDDRADRLLSLALKRMRDVGVVTERGKRRTDSTQVLAAARDLTRLELVLKAVRGALEEATQRAPDVLDGLVGAGWATRYGRPVRLPSQPTHPVTRLKQAGADAHRFLSACRPTDVVLARRCCGRSWCRTSSLTPAALCVPAPRKTGDPKGGCPGYLALRLRSPPGHPG